MNTGSSTQGLRALLAAAMAASDAFCRSASKVPRLTSSASARATNAATSFGAMVIDGTAPAASSTLAVKVCATALVMQCTRGRRWRRRSRISAVI